MHEIFIAGIGRDPNLDDEFTKEWWPRAELDIKRFLAESQVQKLGKDWQVPDIGVARYRVQRYFIRGFPLTCGTVHEMVGGNAVLVGFGLPSYSEEGARDMLGHVQSFLSASEIKHPSIAVSIWVFAAPQTRHRRRLP